MRVGGTGKTPHVEYVIRRLLEQRKHISVLSRGYGRKTKGFLVANEGVNACDIGDEPFQYFSKFGASISVFVGEDRVSAIKKLFQIQPRTDVVVLDDAFQHRYVKATGNIVLTEFNRPFYKDHLMPMGRLRESRNGMRRADLVVVTKCPTGVSLVEMENHKLLVQRYCHTTTPVVFTYISYGQLRSITSGVGEVSTKTNVKVLAGIDNPAPFVSFCKEAFDVTDVMLFPDHYSFSEKDAIRIKEWGAGECSIVTTEKDAARLGPWLDLLKDASVFYLPIEIKFLEGEQAFNKLLDHWVNV